MTGTKEALIIESLFSIADKDGNDVEFKLNSAQKVLDENLTGRDLVPKARQEGVSSYFLARYTAACMMRRNVKAVVISHDMESTQRMLNKVKYFIETIKGPKPVIQNMSKNEITFPKMNSMFYLGTAGARKFGRGDTITHLHCSEFAFWPNAAELMLGLLQAVPMSGEIAIESTGNGLNDYYTRCMRAETGNSRWSNHFLPWHEFAEYKLPVDDEETADILADPDVAMEEDKLVGTLTPGQIAWRRMKLEEINFDLKRFKQEYPMSLDECFQSTGESLFYKVLYTPTDDWKDQGNNLHILEGHPQAGLTYVMGADVSGGVEKDSSCIEVVCIDTMEQVGEYNSNRIAPDTLAMKIVEIGRMFGEPFTIVEQNNHGLVTLSYLQHIYPKNKIYKDTINQSNTIPSKDKRLMRLGYKTTTRTKPLMIGTLRRLLATELLIHSPVMQMELTTFVEHENGSLGAADGCHDDTVMAMACAGMGLERAGAFAPRPIVIPDRLQYKDPFMLDTIIKEMQDGNREFPIKPQHAGSDYDRNGSS